MTASITLHVPRVRCVDETGGSFRERFGNDEMYLGAVFVAISANKSFDVRVSGSKLIGGNFDDKETVNWGKDLFQYDLGDASVYPYPKAVIASLVLAEHDTGNGRNAFLERMAQQFSDQLTNNAIEGAVKQAAVAAGLRGPAAAAAETNANFVTDALKEWAKKKIGELGDYLLKKASDWAGDDIFRPAVKLLDIPSETHTWNGLGDTPEEIVEFVGHEGKYHVSMMWQLRATYKERPVPGPIFRAEPRPGTPIG
jgi:hypothetical protein